MRELRRVLTDHRRVLAAVVIVLLNLGLFLRQQQTSNYGFSSNVDGARALGDYKELLEQYRSETPETAVPELEKQSELSQKYREIYFALLHRDMYNVPEDETRYYIWKNYDEEEYETLRRDYPELMEAVESGTADEAGIIAQSAAASKLAEQFRYIADFDDYLRTVEESVERLGAFSIFAKPGSFAARNIEKTAEDFARLKNVSVTIGRDDALTSFFSFKLTDWLMVVLMLLTAISFLDERRAGLWNTVYAASGGRGRLARNRVAALALSAVLGTAALYGSVLIAGFAIYGGEGELGRAAQSMELFQLLPVRTTLGGVLARFFLLRVLTAFAVGLLLWLLLSAANTSVRWMLVGAAAFISVEYSLYTYLPDLSLWQVLKYFNIFSYIDLGTLYTKYLNLNIFNQPVNIRTLVTVSCMPLIFLLIAGCVTLQCRMRPQHTRVLFARAGRLVGAGLDKLRSLNHLTGFESWKLLVAQGGVLILAVYLFLISGMDYQVHISRTEADNISLALQGEITDETLETLETMDDEIDQVFATSEVYQILVDRGLMDFDTLYDFNLEYSNTGAEQVGLHTVMAKVDGLQAESERLGTQLWLMDELPFQNIYGSEADGVRLSRNLLTLIALSLLLAGFISMERTSPGLRDLVCASSRGRGAIMGRKYLLAALSVLLLWAVPTFFELKTLLSLIDRATLSAPIQSLTFLGKFPWPISIGAFLALLYLGRLAALLSCAFIALWLSSLFHRPQLSYLAVCAVLAAPTLLWNYLHIDLLRPLSAARVTDLQTFVAARSGDPGVALVALGILLLFGVLSVPFTKRRWNKTA